MCGSTQTSRQVRLLLLVVIHTRCLGKDWRSAIAHAIEQSVAVVFLMVCFVYIQVVTLLMQSQTSVQSRYCREEIMYAVNRFVCAIRKCFVLNCF